MAIWMFFIAVFVSLATAAWFFYAVRWGNVIHDNGGYLYVRTGMTYEMFLEEVKRLKLLRDPFSFHMVSRLMKLNQYLKPGRYKIHAGMNNYELISLLRSGRQTPLRFTFSTMRTLPQLIGWMARQFEVDSITLASTFYNSRVLDSLQLDSLTIATIFIPNTYEMYWNTSARNILNRMCREYEKFWNKERLEKASALKLTRTEVFILASIVEQETRREEEKPWIAGVYLNRLRKGWKLEADPTLIFAVGDFSIRRVLNVHKTIDSPFNTYKYKGLPPGPICIPSIASIDAVLNYEPHDFLFFCAREDMSGYHVFARTYQEHMVNARKFRKALDQQGITG
jgi:UPF0755 protein